MALATPVARWLHAHQPRVLPVLHVSDQNAILDQHVLGSRRALVIDRDRAAPVGDGAVIQHGDPFCRDLLAHQPGEGARFLTVEIAFQPVTDRLVQQDAGPARSQRHVHHSRPCRHRLQVHQRDTQRLAGHVLPVIRLQEPRQPGAPAAARAARLAAAVLLDDDADIQPRHGPDIRHHMPLGAQDRDLLQRCRYRRGDLHDPRIEPARKGVDLGKRLDLYREFRIRHGIRIAV